MRRRLINKQIFFNRKSISRHSTHHQSWNLIYMEYFIPSEGGPWYHKRLFLW